MEKKYREVDQSDIGQEIEGSDGEKTLWSDWYRVTLKHIAEPDNDGRKFLGIHSGRWVAFRHARAELPPSYSDLHQASGLKVGDWVKITRAAKSHEQGWAAIWAPQMNNYVGSIAQITLDLLEYGFRIQGAGGFNYPAFVLEKVNHRPATKADEKATVTWDKRPDDEFTLHCVFTADDLSARAVIQNCDKDKRYSEGFLFAFLDDLSIHLPTDPQPPAEPAPAPEPRPAWLPAGFRVMGKDEVIKVGDKVQRNNSPYPPDGVWAAANASTGEKVSDSLYPNDVWITPISEGEANG